MPLLFQCVMQPMALFEQPLFQIHMLGKEAKDDLARPFKAPANPLQEMMGGADAAKPKPKEIKEEKKEAKKTKWAAARSRGEDLRAEVEGGQHPQERHVSYN